MKKTILFLLLIIGINSFAQTPEKLSYQSVMRNPSGALLANQSVGFKFSIIEPNNGNLVVFTELQTVTTNQNGLATLEIGSVAGNLSNVDWSIGPHLLKVEVDPTGGTNYTISSTTQLLSVPYALQAKRVENISGTSGTLPIFGTGNSLTNSPLSINTYNNSLNLTTLTPYMQFSKTVGNSRLYIGYSNVISGGLIGTIFNEDLTFMTNGLNRLTMYGNGKISVNTPMQFGSGRYVSNMQFSTVHIGSAPSNGKQITVTFSNAMPNTNYHVSLTQVNSNASDFFSYQVLNKTTAGFDVMVIRRDQNSGWGQDLQFDWVAICGE
ncbi:MAG: hypothetical protein JST62_02415 [Bacteroidetes bacterium]|nr:hypothetical protein [Bacteroidota bacterium]